MAKVNAEVTNAVVAGKRHGESIQLDKERAEQLEAQGYVIIKSTVKTVPKKKVQPKKSQAKTTTKTKDGKVDKPAEKTSKDA